MISRLLEAVITGWHVVKGQDVKIPGQGVAHALVGTVGTVERPDHVAAVLQDTLERFWQGRGDE